MEAKPACAKRVIMHIDMNAFFASVEQTANPFIANKPVAVGSLSYKNSALVAVSYEARARGVKNLSRALEARAICPELIIVPFDPLKYYSVNRQIVAILREYSPLVEVYSIDEAFVDLTDVLHLYNKTAIQLAQEIKDRIRAEVGFKLFSSVGIAPNKLIAKVASDWKKPDGLTQISWEERLDFLDKVPIQDIWGIGFRGGPKLTRLGINSTRQLRELPDSTLKDIVGSYYTRLRLIANGEHYDPVSPNRSVRPAKSMQHAHTLSNATNNAIYLKTVIRKMSERLASRLRKHNQQAKYIHLYLRPAGLQTYGWGSTQGLFGAIDIALPTNNGGEIYNQACKIFAQLPIADTQIRLVAVGVGNLSNTQQVPFGMFANKRLTKIDTAIDKINSVYGEFTVRTADILHQYAKESELHIDRESMTFHPAGGA